ncbi:MAG TPA: diguanylate cyclase [Chthonomonadaceae bacterium]|nr:diguanylate cyclase [Chthonomonadaceae bacterium]
MTAGLIIAAVVAVIALLASLLLINRNNLRVYRSLRDAYESLDERSREASERTAQLLQTVDELEAVKAELIRSCRGLTEAKEDWERLATTDSVTELANRRAFHDRLREEIARAQRYSYPVLLLMIDVDNFKAYNDALGHPAGDQVLREVAQVLRDTVREGDLVARYGGEEFSAILPLTGSSQGHVVAERLREAVERHEFPHRRITVSVGAAEFDADASDAESLIQSADRALYAAKAAGKNLVVFIQDLLTPPPDAIG